MKKKQSWEEELEEIIYDFFYRVGGPMSGLSINTAQVVKPLIKRLLKEQKKEIIRKIENMHRDKPLILHLGSWEDQFLSMREKTIEDILKEIKA